MKILFVIVISIFLLSCSTDQKRILLDQSDVFVLNSNSFKITEWEVRVSDIDTAFIEIKSFLENPYDVDEWQQEEIKKIKENLSIYRVQVIGIKENGNKKLWFNFFDREYDEESIDIFGDTTIYNKRKWKKWIISVDDGGYGNWRIIYNLKDKKCESFISGGYA